jgi:nucleoside-diphosphate-sugar epimerase
MPVKGWLFRHRSLVPETLHTDLLRNRRAVKARRVRCRKHCADSQVNRYKEVLLSRPSFCRVNIVNIFAHIPKMQKRVLITGGLGFIGSVISCHFEKLGYRLTIVDNLSSNVVSADTIDLLEDFEMIVDDVSRYLQNLSGKERFDIVIHAASYVGAAGVLPYAGKILPSVTETTSAVIEACLRWNAFLVFISSSEVYGTSGVLTESQRLEVPPYANARIEYAIAKLGSEIIIRNSFPRGLSAVCVRPFNVVGPRQSRGGGFVLPTFVQQAIANIPLTVFGDGQQKRSFLAVEDFAEAVQILVLSKELVQNEVFNVGHPENSVSILQLAQRVIALSGRCVSSIEHIDGSAIYGSGYFEAESRDKLCNIDKLNKYGWTPRTGLDSIVRDALEYYTSHRDTRGADVRH